MERRNLYKRMVSMTLNFEDSEFYEVGMGGIDQDIDQSFNHFIGDDFVTWIIGVSKGKKHYEKMSEDPAMPSSYANDLEKFEEYLINKGYELKNE